MSDDEGTSSKTNQSGNSDAGSAPFSPDVLPVLDAAGFRLVPMEPVEIAVHLSEANKTLSIDLVRVWIIAQSVFVGQKGPLFLQPSQNMFSWDVIRLACQ